LEICQKLGASIISVHYEACPHLHRTVQAIRQLGCKAGVAINPHVAPEALTSILEHIDLVLLMSVNPGFGGQKFIDSTAGKVTTLRSLADDLNPDLWLEVDGGVNTDNAASLFQAGADMLVAGSAVFGAQDPAAVITQMKNI